MLFGAHGLVVFFFFFFFCVFLKKKKKNREDILQFNKNLISVKKCNKKATYTPVPIYLS